jgi:hypothetical protein
MAVDPFAISKLHCCTFANSFLNYTCRASPGHPRPCALIQATQRLTSSIIKGDCKGLKGFFECDLESKRTTRSSVKGDLLPPTMKNIPSQGFRHQSVKLWNSKTSVDMQNAKMTKMQLRTVPK